MCYNTVGQKDMSNFPWFKFYGQEYLADMKISQLSIAERQMWITLLCLAHVEGKRGEISYCNENLLKLKMGLQENDREWKELDGFFDLFEKLNMIEKTDNGIILKNFGKRQEMQFTPAEKQKRYREKRGKVTNVTTDEIRIDKIRKEKKVFNVKQTKSTPDKLIPLSALRLWEIAGEKNVRVQHLIEIQKNILEDINGENKYKIKDINLTLHKWLKMDLTRGYIRQMNELERLEWSVTNPEVVAKDRENTRILVEKGLL